MNPRFNHLIKKYYIFATLIFVIGGLVGYGIYSFLNTSQCHSYQFINSQLDCGEDYVISKTGYISLENDLNDYINTEQSAGNATRISIYFRDLENGPIWGINDESDFIPASLLKLPIVMAYFNIAEQQPNFLNTKITYSWENIQSFNPPVQTISPPPTEPQEGQSYSIQDLMFNTIVYSDNLSYFTLVKYINDNYPQEAGQTLQELGIIDPRNNTDQVINSREYASLFRILYDGAYLNLQDSDKLLSWLAQSSFKQGLAAGVPNNVQVANKFGERIIPNGGSEIHDCGVIYYPGNPYLLCVMTQGQDPTNLINIISTVSNMVYKEVDSRKQ